MSRILLVRHGQASFGADDYDDLSPTGHEQSRVLGAALSATLAGSIIVWAGYSANFLTLAAIAGAGFLLYLVTMPETKKRARG